MSTLATGWSTDTRTPLAIVEHHMVTPGATARFELAGVEVRNLGSREAGLALRADGRIVAAVEIGLRGETVQLELFAAGVA